MGWQGWQHSHIKLFIISFLASLNLPAAIEDLSGEQVPKSVLEKAASLREKGGLGVIDQQLQALPDLLTRNREILDEVSNYKNM